MRNFYLLIIAFSLLGCDPKTDNSTKSPPVKQFNKKVKIILIDASGSFSKTYKHNENNEPISLFTSSCEKVIDQYLKTVTFGEQVIVRAILADSYNSEALICNINLTGKEFFFDKIKENGAGNEAVFIEDSTAFYEEKSPEMNKRKENALTKFNVFKERYQSRGTSKTDLCGAFAAVSMDLEQIDKSIIDRELIILSDMQNNTALSRCNQFNANGLKVKVLFMSENGFEPDAFGKFKKNVLEKFFSQAVSIEMNTPSHSE